MEKHGVVKSFTAIRELPGFKRVAHLQKQPLVGGDLATRYPLRMAAGMLQDEPDLENWLFTKQDLFPHGEKEVEVILKQLKNRKDMILTSSCGRVLDAVAAVLGVCHERTYEGEPAMKLESLAIKSKTPLRIELKIEGNTLNTTIMVQEIFKNREKVAKEDLARAAYEYLAEGLAVLAVEKAREKGLKHVGFTGGVACNEVISSTMRKTVESSGLKFLVHEVVPPGDGGTSFGQAAVAGFQSP